MRATLNGTELYFEVEGETTRPTLIALPGGPGFDHGYLKPGLSPLQDKAQIVYVDPRGHGGSGRPPLDTCTLEQMADDIAALADHLGIERPIVFGHSAGGFIALHYALRHRDRVGGLVLCDTSPTMARIPDDEPRPTLASRAPPDVQAIAGRLFGGDFSPETLKEFGEKVGPFYAGPLHADAARVLALSTIATDVMQYFFTKLAHQYDVRPKLGDITAPTLVIVGRHDWVCAPVASRTMAKGIPGAKLVMLEESCHIGFSEEPEAFLAAVRLFLEGIHR